MEERTMVAGLEITSVENAGCCVLTAAGELDMVRARALEVALIRHTTNDMPLVLDLTGLRFMDSSGLYIVLRTSNEFRRLNQRFVLVPSKIVMRLVEVAGMKDILTICPTVEDALAHVGSPMTQSETSSR
jgi:anti-anti-sigma factor